MCILNIITSARLEDTEEKEGGIIGRKGGSCESWEDFRGLSSSKTDSFFLFNLNVFPPGSTHTGQVRVKQYYASLINKVQGVLLQI